MRSVIVALSLIGSVSGLSIGCNRMDATPQPGERPARAADDTRAQNVPADNTKRNERDRNDTALTPTDQGESETDRTITQKVRQAVVKNDSLSMDAKNVKIITVDAKVTLRGPVASDKERNEVAALAQRTEGVKGVDNQLEVARP